MNGKKGNLLDSNSLRQLYKDDTLYQLGDHAPNPAEQQEELPKEPEEVQQDTSPEQEAWQLEGKTSSDLLMVFFHEGPQAIPDDGNAMVQGLVENPKAMNRKLTETACINWEQHKGRDWKELMEQLQAKKVLCWGGFPEGIDLEPKTYEIQELHGVSYLLADSPSILAGNAGLKGKLWMAIKNNWL